MIFLDEDDRPELPEEPPLEPRVEAVPVWVDLEVVVTGTTVDEVEADVKDTPFETKVVVVTTASVCEDVPTLVRVTVSMLSDVEDCEVGETVVVEEGSDVEVVMVDCSLLDVTLLTEVTEDESLLELLETEAPVEEEERSWRLANARARRSRSAVTEAT